MRRTNGLATKRRRFTAQFKAKVATEALRGDRTIQAIAAKYEVHPNQGQRLEAVGAGGSAGSVRRRHEPPPEGSRGDHSRPERQDRRIDRVARIVIARARELSRAERLKMIEREHQSLSVSRQCRLLAVSRSTLYYRPLGESAETLALMRRIDELYLNYPFFGSRQMVRHLAREGVAVGRRRVRRLMRLLGLEAIYRKPRTSVANPEHRVYPYLLRGLPSSARIRCGAPTSTYIPVQGGFFYLVAIMDWASRRVLAWQLSNTLDTCFCLEALAEALAGYGIPEIFNTDQGSQFTSIAFTGMLEASGIRSSMDGLVHRTLPPFTAA